MPRIKIVIADDHALVRSAFRAMLESHPGLEVMGEAADGVEVVEVCRRLSPDVVLMDLSMPGRGGIAAISEIRAAFQRTRVIAVTMHEDVAYARQACLAGVSGYVLKSALADELVKAIHNVFGGGTYFSAAVAESLRQPALPALSSAKGPEPISTSSREREVISLVALGHTTQEIARRLHISERTVESHRRNIMTKLGFQTRADLVRYAIEYGLIQR